MKKFMAMVLVLMMMAMFAGSAMACEGQGYWSTQVQVTGDANLRTGPGLGYKVLDTMYVGETAAYLGNPVCDERGVTWYNVCFEGTVGWVSSVYATLNTMRLCYVVGVSGDSNVRTGAGLSYNSLGTLRQGDAATFLGNQRLDERGVVWYNVSFNGCSAWVSSRYTTLY